MQVELAEERIFRMTDSFSLEHAEGHAWSKRLEAFGALARVTEELVRVEAVDLYYRPVHAFRCRRGDKEAVVEFDAITGETKVGAETLNFVIPGANLDKLMIVKGLELKAGK